MTPVADCVSDALSFVDAHSFDCLVQINVNMLAFHWRSVALQLDKPKTPWRRLDLTQADVGEPLESFFEFGDMQSSAGASKGKGRGARVRFGTHTAAEGVRNKLQERPLLATLASTDALPYTSLSRVMTPCLAFARLARTCSRV